MSGASCWLSPILGASLLVRHACPAVPGALPGAFRAPGGQRRRRNGGRGSGRLLSAQQEREPGAAQDQRARGGWRRCRAVACCGCHHSCCHCWRLAVQPPPLLPGAPSAVAPALPCPALPSLTLCVPCALSHACRQRPGVASLSTPSPRLRGWSGSSAASRISGAAESSSGHGKSLRVNEAHLCQGQACCRTLPGCLPSRSVRLPSPARVLSSPLAPLLPCPCRRRNEQSAPDRGATSHRSGSASPAKSPKKGSSSQARSFPWRPAPLPDGIPEQTVLGTSNRGVASPLLYC